MTIKIRKSELTKSVFSRHSHLGVTIIITHAQMLDLCSSHMLLFEAIYQVLPIREGINKVTKHLLQQFKGIIAM